MRKEFAPIMRHRQLFPVRKTVRLLGLGLVLTGLIIIIPLLQLGRERRQATSRPLQIVSREPLATTPTLVSGRPVSITLVKLHKTLEVITGRYNTQSAEWTVSDSQAVFMDISQPANNQRGDTLIYGHATKRVFGDILTFKPGDTVQVATDTGHIFTYAYESRETVNPEDVGALEYDGPPRLTLQTCTGFYSQNRTMLHFALQDFTRSL